MQKVVILKRYDRDFRIPLYDLMGEDLERRGIQFELVYGQPDRTEAKTIKDLISPHRWGKTVRNRYLYLGKRSICWQPVLRYTRGADLVIAQQGSRLLVNYLLQLKRIFRKKPKLAFWGHGMNFQAMSQKSPLERFKAFYSNYVDYWFAYNTLSKKVMADRGFPEEKIFALQNTIDSKEEGKLYDELSETEMRELREKLGIGQKDLVGIYCGSLYPEKRMDFLIESLLEIKQELPHFHFVIVGDGIIKSQLLEWIRGNESWIHYVGSQFGRDKLKYFRLASFQAITGLVGLNIIDSFVTLTPLITTKNRLHSPEITYLQNRKNGIITENTKEDFGKAIMDFVKDADLQNTMIEGCRKAREEFTIENMAKNYLEGIYTILGNSDK